MEIFKTDILKREFERFQKEDFQNFTTWLLPKHCLSVIS